MIIQQKHQEYIPHLGDFALPPKAAAAHLAPGCSRPLTSASGKALSGFERRLRRHLAEKSVSHRKQLRLLPQEFEDSKELLEVIV